jgi:hypothetical protein
MKKLILALLVLPLFTAKAQQIEYAIFSDTRIISSQSVESNFKGEGTFIISHRFGDIYQNGPESILYNFFGFDGGANMRIGLDYGINDWIMVGGGRNIPVSVSFYTDASFISDTTNALLDSFFVDRFSYSYQLLIARKFSDIFSMQLMPTLIHRNLVATREEKNDVFAMGVAAKVNVTPTLALSGEYFYTLPNQLPAGYNNYMAFGIDIETKGHVFQIQLTNSPFLIPEYYIGATQGSIIDEAANGDFDLNLRLGFNITRDFQLGGRVY